MNNKLLYPIVLLFLSQGAIAHEMQGCEGHGRGMRGPPFGGPALLLPGVLNDRPAPKEGPCADVKLDKAQKDQIKEAYFKFKDLQIDLEAAADKARLNKEKVEADPKTDFAAAEAATAAEGDAFHKLMQATETYRNSVLYNVLKPEQRAPARACWREEHHWGGKAMGPKDHGPKGHKDGEKPRG